MWQFSIRSLLLLVFVAAVFFGIAQTAGYVFSAGIVAAVSAFVWAVVRRRRGAAMLACVALWFLALDLSCFLNHCPDCGCDWYSYQYRVLGMPVRTQIRDFPTIVQLVLGDLGVPCEHRDCEPWHEYRLSGLVLPTWYRHAGTFLVGDTDRYTDAMAAKVRRLGVEYPQLAVELYDMVLREGDYQNFWRTIEDSLGEPIVSQPPTSDSGI